jgi:catechol 2,3-dioxygenase-like lactoylglutathione lyase family enzyme
MTSRIGSITFDCVAWEPLVEFWSAALGFIEDPDDPNRPGDPAGFITSPTRDVNMLFIPVPEAKTVKNRVHIDLVPVDRTRDDEVDRLLALGASFSADFRKPDGTGFVVLTDPEGNELCIEQSEAERSASRETARTE